MTVTKYYWFSINGIYIYTKWQLYDHWHPISKTIKVRQTKHAGHCWRSKYKLISVFSYGPLHMNMLVLANQQELTYNSSAQTQDVVWKTCPEQWMVGMDRERERVWEICACSVTWWWWSWWYIYIYIYIYIYMCVCVCVCLFVLVCIYITPSLQAQCNTRLIFTWF